MNSLKYYQKKEEMKADISERIKHYRKEKGMTQDDLARKANIKYSTLAKLESKHVVNPRMETLIKIAEGLEITIDDLIKK